MTPTILQCSGEYFDFEDPESSDMRIESIAHALSNICRFTGHTREHYSVAQHSVYVSMIVPKQDALAGLLHDAAEAWLGDVSKPLKALLPDYRAIEKRVEAAVLARYGLATELPASVKMADRVMLITEKRDLMPRHHDCWDGEADLHPLRCIVRPMKPEAARKWFLDRFLDLTVRWA